MRSPEQPARFKKTVSLQHILNYVDKPQHSVFEEFEKWPLLEIRRACLRTIRVFTLDSDWPADWAETCVRELGWYTCGRDEMAEEILSWYVFAPKLYWKLEKNVFAIRAVEFAISAKEYMTINFISKIVCGRICQTPFLYPLAPSLPAFLGELLDEVTPHHAGQKKEYMHIDWVCAERALKMIMAGKDYSFLPKIEELIALLQNRIIYPSSHEPPYTKDLHLVMLRATIKILKEAQREALRNPEST